MTVTIVRQIPSGDTDRYGDPVPGGDEYSPLLIEVPGCAVAPRSSNDVNEPGRQGVIVGVSLYAPAGTDILHDDQVDIDGVLYDVDGDAGVWTDPFSFTQVGVEVALRRAAG